MNLFIPDVQLEDVSRIFSSFILVRHFSHQYNMQQEFQTFYTFKTEKWKTESAVRHSSSRQINARGNNWSILARVLNFTPCEFSASSAALPGEGCTETLLSDFSLERRAWQEVDAGLY